MRVTVAGSDFLEQFGSYLCKVPFMESQVSLHADKHAEIKMLRVNADAVVVGADDLAWYCQGKGGFLVPEVDRQVNILVKVVLDVRLEIGAAIAQIVDLGEVDGIIVLDCGGKV